MTDGAASGSHDLAEMDASGVTAEHGKIMSISGMGFFTDVYDLFIIGVVMAILAILKDESHPSDVAVGLVTSTALIAAAFGAILFGRVADMVGRKRIYGVEVLVLAAGAIASAFSPDVWGLIGFRVVLGIGIGGDHPVSATLMGEFAGKNSRDRMASLVSAMQAAGLVVGPLLAAALLATGLDHDHVWRILLAAAMMDRIGRKSIQILGFTMMAPCFLASALIPGIERLVYPFLVIYGLSYFFTEFGPNATTFVYPAELFPVEGRTTGHGIASASGEVGGFVGVFLFPILLGAVTLFMPPETLGKGLEEISAEGA